VLEAQLNNADHSQSEAQVFSASHLKVDAHSTNARCLQ
jgi:hypothetical protein